VKLVGTIISDFESPKLDTGTDGCETLN
jgi:hypothetical protein